MGKDGTPTAERACRPASPNTSTRKSDAPLATKCCSENSGVLATKTVIFKISLILSRSPKADLACIKMLMAHHLAASWPVGTSTLSPKMPVANNAPSLNPQDAAADWGYAVNTLYAQDEWSVNPQLTRTRRLPLGSMHLSKPHRSNNPTEGSSQQGSD